MFTCQEVVVAAVTCLRRQCTNFHTSLDTRVLLPVATPQNKGTRLKHTARSAYSPHIWYNLSKAPQIPIQHCAPYCATGRLGLEFEATIGGLPQ